MTNDTQELQGGLDEQQENSAKRKREHLVRSRTDEHTVLNALRIFHAAALAAGYIWEDGEPIGSVSDPIRQGRYILGNDPHSDAVKLVGHSDKKFLLAAWLAGNGLAFDNSEEFLRRWVDGDNVEDIAHLLPT